MALRTRVWGAGKVVALIGALLATYLVFAAAAARMAFRAREVRVPDLRGRSLNEATVALADLGLTLKVDESRRADLKIPIGQVALQQPAAGTPARHGRSVRVWLSAGTRAATVPRLLGETQRTAEMRLHEEGLSVAAVSEVFSNDFPSDAVIGQDPAPNGSATAVSLLVNRGERAATYLMPDLIGVNGDRAADILRARGFRVTTLNQQPYPGVPPGVVLHQTPQAGFQISPGEPISLEVSR